MPKAKKKRAVIQAKQSLIRQARQQARKRGQRLPRYIIDLISQDLKWPSDHDGK